ncbi:MAG: hypothetical protein ABI700_10540, partial [Chloroflexota bacterium]
ASSVIKISSAILDLAMFARVLQFKPAFVKIIAWRGGIGAQVGLRAPDPGCVYAENRRTPFAFHGDQRLK